MVSAEGGGKKETWIKHSFWISSKVEATLQRRQTAKRQIVTLREYDAMDPR